MCYRGLLRIPLVHSVSIGSGGGIVLWPLYAHPQSVHTCGSLAGRLVYHVAWPGRMGITNGLHSNLALNLHYLHTPTIPADTPCPETHPRRARDPPFILLPLLPAVPLRRVCRALSKDAGEIPPADVVAQDGVPLAVLLAQHCQCAPGKARV